MDTPPFEASVGAISEVAIEGQLAKPRRLLGTATLLRNGCFLTAGHVMDAVSASQNDVSIPVPANDGGFIAAKIISFDIAPKIDLAIGRLDVSTNSEFVFDEKRCITLWQDTIAMGYPASSIELAPDKIKNNMRAFRGIVQRSYSADGITPKDFHDYVELNFTMGQGASGSPLFYTPSLNLFGIYIGSKSHEVVLESVETVDTNGSREMVRVIKMEHIGVGVLLHPLLDWVPACTEGRSLRDILCA